MKRKRVLLESNSPRNSQLETHRSDGAGGMGSCKKPCNEVSVPIAPIAAIGFILAGVRDSESES